MKFNIQDYQQGNIKFQRICSMAWLLGALNHRFWSPRMDRCTRRLGRIAPPTCIAWPICIIWRPSTHLVESAPRLWLAGLSFCCIIFAVLAAYPHFNFFLVLALSAFLEISKIFFVITHSPFFVGRWVLVSRVGSFLQYSGHYASILLHFSNF